MSSRENPKTKIVTVFTPERCQKAACTYKTSCNRIATRAKQQKIANEVREKIIDHLKIAVNAKREEQTA